MTASIALRYHRVIEWIGHSTGLPDTILHIHAGMAILILVGLITGRSLGSFVPLAWTIFAELGNEVMDRLYFGAWRWPDTTSDLINTLLWPLVISVAVCARARLTVPAQGTLPVGDTADLQ